MENKRLYRSVTDRKIAGVCGGIAEYFNIDPTAVRVLWAVLSLFGGGGIIAYIIAALIMPDRTGGYNNGGNGDNGTAV